MPADSSKLKAVGRVLGLFAKHPSPGRVKTRLAADTSSAWAAQVAEAFLLDLLDRYAAIDARRVVAYAPCEEEAYFRSVLSAAFDLAPQTEGDLGERMATFFTERFSEGSSKVVLLGTDSPTLPVEIIEQAFQELESSDLVLGPAADGGYYLIGCSGRLPPIFKGITWSGPGVLRDTIAQLSDPSWRVALLPPWYDVDTLTDWQTLRGHAAALQRAGIDPGLPRTLALDWPGG